MMNTTKTLSVAAALTMTLSACGGGQTGTSTPESAATNDVIQAMPDVKTANGIYQGTMGFSAGNSELVSALVYDGQVMAFSPNHKTLFDGYLDLGIDDTVTGEVTQFAGETLKRGSRASLNGVLEPRSFINAAIYGSSNPGEAYLDYSKLSTQAAGLKALGGVWTWYSAAGGESVALYMDDRGALDGSDQQGCVYHGRISAPDAALNVYLIDVSISACRDYNGDYQGMAYLDAGTELSRKLQFAITNGVHGFAYALDQRSVLDRDLPAPGLPESPDQVDLPSTPETPDYIDVPETPDRIDVPDAPSTPTSVDVPDDPRG